MRRFLIVLAIVMALLAVLPLGASVCDAKERMSKLRRGGLSIDHYIADAALHRRWAVMVDCEHPDWPWTLQATPWESGAGTTVLIPKHVGGTVAAMPLIPAGSKVRLWRIAGGASVELSGTALEAGAAGQTIHVRTGQHGTVLNGVVRGAGSIELFTPDRLPTKPATQWNRQ